jgi:bacteriorhodopsin
MSSSSLTVPDSLTKVSFYGTYAFLVTTGTITFIEAMRTNIAPIRHILNLETCISIVAAYFYSKFVKDLEQSNSTEPFQAKYNSDTNQQDQQDHTTISSDLYAKINETRYTDWMITTPIMLLVLCLAFQYNNTLTGGLGKSGGIPTSVPFILFLVILLMNWGMIASGYLAETKKISKRDGLVFGFLFFFVLFAILYFGFLHGATANAYFQNIFLFLVFFVLWSIYGIVYWLEDEATKNTSYNILDLFSKCFVGIFFWAYFTGIF